MNKIEEKHGQIILSSISIEETKNGYEVVSDNAHTKSAVLTKEVAIEFCRWNDSVSGKQIDELLGTDEWDYKIIFDYWLEKIYKG